MSENNNPTQQPIQEEATPQKTKKAFLTPFTFSIGCGGLILIIILALGGMVFYMNSYMLSEKPLDFEMPEVSQENLQSATAKLDGLKEKKSGEISITEEEANAFFQKKILPDLIDKELTKPPKGRLTINDDNTISVQLSLPYSFPFLSEKYLNLDYKGKAVIKDGTLELIEHEKAVVGTFEDFSKEISSFFNTLNKNQELTSVYNSITVEDKQILVKLKSEKEKQEKAESKEKSQEKDQGKDNKTAEPEKELNTQEKDPVEKDPVEKDPVEKDPVEKDPVEKEPAEKTPAGDDSPEMDSTDQGSGSKDSDKE